MKKRNNIIDNIKSTWVNFKDWLDYVKDCKKNMEKVTTYEDTIKGLNETIDTLKRNLETEIMISKEKDESIKLLDNRIQIANQRYSYLKKEEKENSKKIQTLEKLVIKKEHQRRINASAMGGLKKQINSLEDSLERANLKINWLQNNQKAPSKEEILAYDFQFKEVERRQKNGK